MFQDKLFCPFCKTFGSDRILKMQRGRELQCRVKRKYNKICFGNRGNQNKRQRMKGNRINKNFNYSQLANASIGNGKPRKRVITINRIIDEHLLHQKLYKNWENRLSDL